MENNLEFFWKEMYEVMTLDSPHTKNLPHKIVFALFNNSCVLSHVISNAKANYQAMANEVH